MTLSSASAPGSGLPTADLSGPVRVDPSRRYVRVAYGTAGVLVGSAATAVERSPAALMPGMLVLVLAPLAAWLVVRARRRRLSAAAEAAVWDSAAATTDPITSVAVNRALLALPAAQQAAFVEAWNARTIGTPRQPLLAAVALKALAPVLNPPTDTVDAGR